MPQVTLQLSYLSAPASRQVVFDLREEQSLPAKSSGSNLTQEQSLLIFPPELLIKIICLQLYHSKKYVLLTATLGKTYLFVLKSITYTFCTHSHQKRNGRGAKSVHPSLRQLFSLESLEDVGSAMLLYSFSKQLDGLIFTFDTFIKIFTTDALHNYKTFAPKH